MYKKKHTLIINPFSDNNYYIFDDGSLYIQIPNKEDLLDISNINVEGSNYEIILDKNIVGKVRYIFAKGYNIIFIRLYDFDNIEKIKVSFDMTFSKNSKIKSCL